MKKLQTLLALLAVITVGHARAQDSHESHKQFHAFYQDWKNGMDKGCCNDRDCRPLSEAHEREVKGVLMVYIKGVGAAKEQAAWCPVLPHHSLIKGNAPDWKTAHVCVTDHYGGKTPCEQFICYQPTPRY